jgi:hypothetical protein
VPACPSDKSAVENGLKLYEAKKTAWYGSGWHHYEEILIKTGENSEVTLGMGPPTPPQAGDRQQLGNFSREGEGENPWEILGRVGWEAQNHTTHI